MKPLLLDASRALPVLNTRGGRPLPALVIECLNVFAGTTRPAMAETALAGDARVPDADDGRVRLYTDVAQGARRACAGAAAASARGSREVLRPAVGPVDRGERALGARSGKSQLQPGRCGSPQPPERSHSGSPGTA